MAMHPTIHRPLIHTMLALSGKPVGKRLRFSRSLQYQDTERIHAHQREELLGLLEHFRDHLEPSRYPTILQVSKHSLKDLLAELPLMEKQQLNKQYQALQEQGFPTGKDVIKRTSGSTGNPMTLIKDHHGLACELAATWRSYEWAGVRMGDPGIRIWGRPFTRWQRLKQAGPDFILNRKRLSAFNLDASVIQNHLDVITRRRPTYLYGYTSILVELAQALQRSGRQAPQSLRAIIPTAEPLEQHSRELIEQAFGARCYNEYGCTEVGSIAHECKHGSLHLMADNLIVETINTAGEPVLDEEGELVITDLTNRSMPIIRYQVGDYGKISSRPCPCGRKLPVLASMHGRVLDLLQTPDGRLHNPAILAYIINLLIKNHPYIEKYQAIQISKSRIILKIISREPSKLNKKNLKKDLDKLLKDYFGEGVKSSICRSEKIERESSGKYRTIKRTFPAREDN